MKTNVFIGNDDDRDDIIVYLYIGIPRGYSTSETSVHFIGYHFVWCPKYRRKVLVGKATKSSKS
jgi:hypothetical protein